MQGEEFEPSGPPDIRIDLPVDARLPESYVLDQDLRLEAYRRLASADTLEEVDDVVSEWEDRFGPLPEEARSLISLARLRAEAIRVGIKDLVKLRHEVRMSPVDLKPSQEVRLQRLQPRAVLRATEGELFIPAPEPLLDGVIAFLREMWPESE